MHLDKKFVIGSIVTFLLIMGIVQAYTKPLPTPGHGADTILISVGGQEKTLQEAINDGSLPGGEIKWNPLTINLGNIPNRAGPNSFDIPSSVPTNAKEILVYLRHAKGGGGGRDIDITFSVYSMETSGLKYVYKVYTHEYDQNAWVTNSANVWLPVTSERKLYVSPDNTMSGSQFASVEILGYRTGSSGGSGSSSTPTVSPSTGSISIGQGSHCGWGETVGGVGYSNAKLVEQDTQASSGLTQAGLTTINAETSVPCQGRYPGTASMTATDSTPVGCPEGFRVQHVITESFNEHNTCTNGFGPLCDPNKRKVAYICIALN